jgi:hypothetical protein
VPFTGDHLVAPELMIRSTIVAGQQADVSRRQLPARWFHGVRQPGRASQLPELDHASHVQQEGLHLGLTRDLDRQVVR